MFSKQDLKELKDMGAVEHFDTILNSDFKRGTPHAMNVRVAELLDAARGQVVNRNLSCRSCVYELYKQAGRLYYESLAHIQKENLEKARAAKKAKQTDPSAPGDAQLPAPDPSTSDPSTSDPSTPGEVVEEINDIVKQVENVSTNHR